MPNETVKRIPGKAISLESLEGQISKRDAETAMFVSEVLMGQYEGYTWMVNCSWETGMLDIRTAELPSLYGYRLHLRGPKAAATASEFKHSVMLGAGEMLERYKLDRGKMDIAQVLDLPRNSLGVIQGDIS